VFGNIARIIISLNIRLVKIGDGDRLGIDDDLDIGDWLRRVIIQSVIRNFEASSQLSGVSNLLDLLAEIELRIGESGLARVFPDRGLSDGRRHLILRWLNCLGKNLKFLEIYLPFLRFSVDSS